MILCEKLGLVRKYFPNVCRSYADTKGTYIQIWNYLADKEKNIFLPFLRNPSCFPKHVPIGTIWEQLTRFLPPMPGAQRQFFTWQYTYPWAERDSLTELTSG